MTDAALTKETQILLAERKKFSDAFIEYRRKKPNIDALFRILAKYRNDIKSNFVFEKKEGGFILYICNEKDFLEFPAHVGSEMVENAFKPLFEAGIFAIKEIRDLKIGGTLVGKPLASVAEAPAPAESKRKEHRKHRDKVESTSQPSPASAPAPAVEASASKSTPSTGAAPGRYTRI
ncbi:MAG: hypothetical protein LBT02_02430 [Rickettsiales bacterium]|jgi:hypothetical protein|nr:hypothetical protein [Rickettsiales bacterium]